MTPIGGPDGPYSLPERRVDVAERLRSVERQIHALKDHSSVRKNGHTWWQYLGKWFATPERVLLFLVMVFEVGGRVQEMRSGMSAAVTEARDAKAAITAAAAESSAERAELREEIVALQRTVRAQQVVIAQQAEKFASKTDVASVNERIRLNVSRHEFQEFQRTVLPTLQRIESSVRDKP